MSDEDIEHAKTKSSNDSVDILGSGKPVDNPLETNESAEVDFLGLGDPFTAAPVEEISQQQAGVTSDLLGFETNAPETESVPLQNGLETSPGKIFTDKNDKGVDSASAAAIENSEQNSALTSDLLGFETNVSDSVPLNNGLESFPKGSAGDENAEDGAKDDHAVTSPSTLELSKETKLETKQLQEREDMMTSQDQAAIDAKNIQPKASDENFSQDDKICSSISTTARNNEENLGSETTKQDNEIIGQSENITDRRDGETKKGLLLNGTKQESEKEANASNALEKEENETEDNTLKVQEIVEYYEEIATQTKLTSIGVSSVDVKGLANEALLEQDNNEDGKLLSDFTVGNATTSEIKEKEPSTQEQNVQPKLIQHETAENGILQPADPERAPTINKAIDHPLQITPPTIAERDSSTATMVDVPPQESSNAIGGEAPDEDPVQNTRPDIVERDTSSATIVELPTQEAPIEQTEEEDEKLDPTETQALIIDLQAAVQEHLNGREAAVERATKAESRVRYLEGVVKSKNAVENELTEVKALLESAKSDRENLLVELEKLRENRDEHERKQIVLSNRLNAAKKQEASKTNHAEKLEDEIKVLDSQLMDSRNQLETIQKENNQLSEKNSIMTKEYEERIGKLESNLREERRLNDERKKKMKVFVENKQEEIRNSQSQNDELNMELSQTNRSLREHHSRWKQLHAQWVQSQTRNRELQRDINRMKKESENMSRLGDKMNQKMAQSAQETEEHKNKRMNAKQELMTLLNTLESEREVSRKLRDSIKFTFTPKALSQQQILKESIRDFEDGLVRLSQRLSKPLPPRNEAQEDSINDDAEDEDENDSGKNRTRSEIDSTHLLNSLEGETQRVSQCIMAMSSNIERLHMLVSQSGERSCASVLSDLLAGAAGVSGEETTSMTRPRMAIGTSQNYGQVPTVND